MAVLEDELQDAVGDANREQVECDRLIGTTIDRNVTSSRPNGRISTNPNTIGMLDSTGGTVSFAYAAKRRQECLD